MPGACDPAGTLPYGAPSATLCFTYLSLQGQDFAAGAMENTGAITYREAALLIDEKESSLATRQRVAQVVAHELSHQVRQGCV